MRKKTKLTQKKQRLGSNKDQSGNKWNREQKKPQRKSTKPTVGSLERLKKIHKPVAKLTKKERACKYLRGSTTSELANIKIIVFVVQWLSHSPNKYKNNYEGVL